MKTYYKAGIVIIILMCMVFGGFNKYSYVLADSFDDYSDYEEEYYGYEEEYDDYDTQEDISIEQCILWGVIGGIIFTAIITMVEFKKHRPVEKATTADYYVNENDVKMSRIEDSYLRTTEVKTKVNSPDSNRKG